MTFYADMAATATALLTEFGQTITLTRDTGGIADPVTGVHTPGTPTNLTAVGLFTAIDKQMRESFGDVQGNDRALILDSSQTPQEGDRVDVSGEDWSIVRIQETNPAGTPLVYRVLIRK